MSTESKADERFWSKVEVGDCWHWTAAKTPKGYGRFRLDGRLHYPHRIVYEGLVGPIQPDMTIDHLCRNTSCVNPDHMEVVSSGENTKRGVRRHHCPRGHNRSAPGGSTPRGECRACMIEYHRKRRRR